MLEGFVSVKRKLSRLSFPPIAVCGHPNHQTETVEDVLFRVQNHRKSLCVTVTSAVKLMCFETIAATRQQKRKTSRLEFYQNVRKIANDQRIKRGQRMEWAASAKRVRLLSKVEADSGRNGSSVRLCLNGV
jgi:alpha-mannosidase